MALFSMNQFSPIPLAEGDQHRSHLPSFTLATDASPCSRPILSDASQERGANYGVHHSHLLQQEPNERPFIRKSSDHLITFPTRYDTTTTTDRFRRKRRVNSDHVIMSKPRRNMQVVQDRVLSIQDGSTSSSSINGGSPSGVIRVCLDCDTTKTPLWRSGPCGPKSLCNACGIRRRKARRAMDRAAASGGLIPGEVAGKVRKERRSDVDRTIPFKKRCKNDAAAATATQNKKLCFDDVMVSLSKSSAVHRVFPQDERDAALLLMALSWGIVCS